MFTNVLVPLVLISRVLASPVASSAPSSSPAPSSQPAPSFNDLGISSLSGFDNFYGVNNFDGSQSAQIIVEQQQETVCQSLSVEVIQQKLVILQEVAKRIISEQVCEVETQTVVLEQFQSGIEQFSKTVVRKSEKQVGFDSNIAGLLGKIVNSDGSLSTGDLGFTGSDVGNSTVVPTGNNWNSSTSPASTGKVKDAAKQAAKASNKNNSSNSTSSSYGSSSSSSSSSSVSTSTTSAGNATSTSA